MRKKTIHGIQVKWGVNDRVFFVGLSLNTCPQAYVDPHKYGNPEKAVRKFAKEIDRREIKLEGLIGEGKLK